MSTALPPWSGSHLLLIGASHRTAPIELREKLDFSSRGLASALKELAARRSSREAVVVSTCNRSEIYVACDDVEPAREDMTRFMCDFHRVSADLVAPHLYSYVDVEAARHLFKVASGLDSLVVGEPQILGQVKDAYSTASTEQRSGPLLNKLFHSAFAVGKRVRSETALAEGAVSVSFAAVALAKKIFGSLTGRRVLVVGAGEMGKLTALHLKSHGIAHLAISSRTRAAAEQLAADVGGVFVPWDRLSAALLDSDIVITATGSSTPILDRRRVAAAIPASRTRPLFLIDVAVPRDVAADVGELEQVFLYNIDDLQAIVRENLQKRGAEIAQAERIVDDEATKFAAWQRARGAIPTVVALRQRFESIRRAELERLEPKLAQLSPEARVKIDEITRLIIEKLLLHPTEQLKAVDSPDAVTQYADALGRLFALGQPDIDRQRGGADQPPLDLRGSAEAVAKAETASPAREAETADVSSDASTTGSQRPTSAGRPPPVDSERS
ncbi:MAG: glutamyl-tRNA reductase [Acidobacteria bacterium]|nr:glutamyl-tRNA reductase [Acidobacteriota bacterium]